MHPLDHMLRARSVAVVGASPRRGTVGDMTLRQLQTGGFAGSDLRDQPGLSGDRRRAMPGCRSRRSDNPSTWRCSPSPTGGSRRRRARRSRRAPEVSPSSPAVMVPPPTAHLSGTASQPSPAPAGVPICGGNGMGFLNVEDGLRVCGFYQPETLVPGGVTFLSHSGSMFSAMLHNERGIGFNLVVSTGLELNTRDERLSRLGPRPGEHPGRGPLPRDCPRSGAVHRGICRRPSPARCRWSP